MNRLLERDDVLHAAARVLDRAREGQACTLFVLAEARLGKTAALQSACERASEAGFSTGHGQGEAMEAVLPFGLLAHTLGGLGGPDPLTGGGEQPSAPDRRAATFYAVRRWLESAASGPLLLALDDLHWADADSLALLSFLCRRLSSLPVAVIATLRPWPTSATQVAEALAGDGYAVIERLQPLTRQGTATLLADQVGRKLSDAEVDRAADICAGNPLLLQQVAMAIARGEELPRPVDGRRSELSGQLLLARFAGLPSAGLACARAGAVLGAHFRPDLVGRVADLPESEADHGLDALERSGLVRPSRPGWVEFVHPLFRQALYDDLGGSMRARYHTRAFSLLVECGLEDEAVEHAIQADLAGDQRAVMVLQRVAKAARSKGAFASAVSILESAAALAGDRAGPELLCDLATALASGGRPADAVGLCERILDLAGVPMLLRARTLQALARAHVYLGAFEAAARRVDECVALTKTVEPDFAAETLLSYSRAALFLAGPPATLPVLERARAISRACDPAIGLSIEVGWALMALDTGDPSGIEGAQAAAKAAEAASATATDHALLASGGAIISYATLAKITDRLAESEHYYRVRLRITERLGSVDEEAVALFGCFGTLLRRLRLIEAAAFVERCAKLADMVPLVAPYSAVDRANLCLLTGRLEESEESARRAEAIITALGAWQPSLHLAYGRAWRCLVEGRLADACALYEQIETTSIRVGLREPCEVQWARHAVAAYVQSGRVADAERVVRWLEECATTLPCRWPRIAIVHSRALIAEAAGAHEQADRLFQTAMAIHEDVDLPLEHLQTVLEFGRFLRRSGQVQRARPLLAKAVAISEAAGAQWLAGQARAELRVAGGRMRRQQADPRTLTAQEERVAALAADGATNLEIASALFISVSTVETHMEHIFRKLAIRSRRELRNVVAGKSA